MAREFFRPYNTILTIADTAQHNVLLTDTSGGALKCNYVSITAVSGMDSADQMLQVVPSGVDTMYGPTYGGTGASLANRNLGPSAYPNASARNVSGEASGVLGTLVNAAAGTAILSLAPQDATTALILTQSTVDRNTYAITYGQVKLANQMADLRKPMGESTWTP